MKISAITDVITNSSTEVFTIVDKSDVDRVKKVINSILTLGKSQYTCDDIFNIEYSWDWDCLMDYWDDYHDDYEEFKSIENPTHEILSKFGDTYINNSWEGSIPEPLIRITSKTGEIIPSYLNQLGYMFGKHTSRYC